MSESSVEAVEYNPDNCTQQLYVLSSDCLGELSHVYFQFADFLLYDCTMINHGFEVNYMMNYISPHRKLQNPEIIFGTLVQTTQQQFIGHIVKFCRW